MRNLTLALRALRATPVVTAVAVLSLALGIGANAAIFSLFDQLLLRPLPVAAPERLVNLSAPGPKPGSTSCSQAGDCDAVFSYPMFRDLERARTGLAGLAAHRGFGANLAVRGQTLNGEGLLVSGSYFPVLGLRPALGRLLGPADDRTIGGHFVAVLSHAFWESRLGGDPGVVGSTITVNGQTMTIVGVAPRGFQGTVLGEQPYLFVPLTMRSVVSPWFPARSFEERRTYWAYLFGRLPPGGTLAQAARQLEAVYRPIITDVEAPLQEGLSATTLARFRAKPIELAEGARGQSQIHREARTPMAMLLATTGIVLLIACANIANLLLARGAARAGEMAVRMSLGAGRRRLLAQLMTESLVLAALGGVVSLVVARWTLSAFAATLPTEAAGVVQVTLDWRLVGFATLVTLATGVLFGLFPALHSTRADLIQSIRAGAGQIAGGARTAMRFRTALVTTQIALSMALLVSAGLFVRSLVNVAREELGIEAEQVVTFAVSPELNGYGPARSAALFERLQAELAATPGITGVALARVPILSGDNWGNDVSVEGFRRDPDTDANARMNQVSPEYFRTLGVPLLRGRAFTEADRPGAPRVAIVNEAFTRKFGLGRDAVGKRMAVGREEDLDIQIVGVVRDAKYSEVKGEVPPVYFTPWRQDTTVGALAVYVRGALPAATVLRLVPGVVRRLDPDLPLERLRTLTEQVRENTFLDRLVSTMSAGFATLATLLAAVGLYGVLAYTVAQRTREIGVRMALGADAGHVRGIVLRQVGVMALVGGAIGLAGALGLGRAARSLLYGLEGHDLPTIVGATLVLGLVALGAGWIPARRAARTDPVQALRYE